MDKRLTINIVLFFSKIKYIIKHVNHMKQNEWKLIEYDRAF